MNVLIVGGGGREHALAWKAAQSKRVGTVFVAPGNAGTALEPGIENVPIAADDIIALRYFAQEHGIGLTIVGPEAALVLGIVDEFRAAGLRCFGPTKAAAQLEGSKAYCKDFLARHGIPTAAYRTVTQKTEAWAYIRERGAPLVVKADGLASGKGVIIAQTEDEAIAAVEDMLSGNVYGAAGHRVVIEEFLVGEEASFIVMADGVHALPMATSQDHKARDDGDAGPNTGGMGAYSPAPVVTPEIHERVLREIIEPTLRGMTADGQPYTGFLYAGLMIAPDGSPKVLEFNCRFGDPETQPIMLRLQSDLVELCELALDGKLDLAQALWDPRPALGVVLAAGGYPFDFHRGDVIEGLPETESADTKVFHAGTSERGGHVVTAGGRVLCACALGDDIAEAQHKAYALADSIRWQGIYFRRDIGHKAIARSSR
ncbi:phosphoribosylamine--glycine ligase [Methylococcus sp. EFPC2]|uniref:phosphoribosylamine--glycine ligase n=1 Tax=Methylococcus sp. EFPC2 TaxID=2812648 RepID=UPI001966DDF6|nr:phosphoribosylamine--glycine ligase [Methylococcus sp. EFPC2]QSA96070.1 phosphoribosylamine--glycine ligase [Methylococcus sp. EFPC2]